MDFLEKAYEKKDEFLRDLSVLIAAKSIKNENVSDKAPFGDDIRKALDEILSMGKRDGFEVEDVDGYAGVIKMGEGDSSFGILAHLDTVPFGKGWTRSPDKLTIEGDYLFGRGVLDDKGPLLAAYYAMRLVKEAGIPLNREVRLIAGTDEEAGMNCVQYYREHGRIPNFGFSPDAMFPAIYAEKGRCVFSFSAPADGLIKEFVSDEQVNVVIAEARAVLSIHDYNQELFDFYCRANEVTGSIEETEQGVVIEMQGKAAHGSTPYNGINAAMHLFNYIASAYDDPLAKDFYTLLGDWKGTALGLYTEGVYMGLLTINVGQVLTEDGKIRVLVDMRFPNDLTIQEIEEIVAKNTANVESPIEARLLEFENPLFVDPNSKLVTELMASYQKYSHDYFTPPIAIGGGTYAKKFQNFVAFGPSNIYSSPHFDNNESGIELNVGGCHQADEGIKLDELLQAIAIYADAITRLAGQS